MKDNFQMGKSVYFPFLDGLRAIAIVWVILHHIPASFPSFLAQVFVRGDLGVEIFFAISGFVVIQSLHSSKNLKEFYFKRIFRIFPGYYSVLGLILLLGCLIPSLGEKLISVRSILWSFPFFFYNYVASASDQIPGSLNVFWSLCFEEQFYVFLGFIFFIASSRKKKVLPWIYLFIVGLRMSILSMGGVSEEFILRIHTHLRLDAILIGCLVYEYQDELKTRVKPFWVWVSLLGFAIFSSLHSAVSLWGQGLVYLGLNLSIGGMLAGLLRFPGKLGDVFSMKWLTLIGVSSFEIYLLHEIVIGALVKTGLARSPYLLLTSSLLVSILVGYAMHIFFTKPINVWLRLKFLDSGNKFVP